MPLNIKEKSGIISHNAIHASHPDGSFLALYTWLRLKKAKSRDKAYDLCKTLMKQHFIKATLRSDPKKQIVLLDVSDENLK